MNRWKAAFFILAGLIAASMAYLIFLIGMPANSEPLPNRVKSNVEGNHLTVRATKEDFEGIANTYIRRAIKGEPLPVTLSVEEDIILSSELTVFSYKLPIQMHFDPVVQENGNLLLKQSSVEVGKLNIPPSTALKLLKDSVKLPSWMVVRPKEEELFIDLNGLPISGDIHVEAKEFNLDQDEILLEVTIPKK